MAFSATAVTPALDVSPLSARRSLLSSEGSLPARSRRAGGWRKQQMATVRAESQNGAAEPSSPPKISLKFISHKAGDEVKQVAVGSGEKQLRKLMLEEKVSLYDAYGSLMNCGGAGNCGTCLVEVLEGGELLSERTDAELRSLKKRPESWRLACQTIVGDKTNAGEVTIQCLPQKVNK